MGLAVSPEASARDIQREERIGQIYDLCVEFVSRYKRFPTVKWLVENGPYSSLSSVHGALEVLTHRGLLERHGGEDSRRILTVAAIESRREALARWIDSYAEAGRSVTLNHETAAEVADLLRNG